jgi:hypothetical protein
MKVDGGSKAVRCLIPSFRAADFAIVALATTAE